MSIDRRNLRHAVADNGILTSYIDAAHQLLARDRLSMTFESDLTDWVQIMRSAALADGMNTAFDPACVGDVEASYFIHVRDRDGETAAVMAARMITTDDYHAYMRAGRLWLPAGKEQPIPFVIDEPGPSGRLSHCGGLWVNPKWRSIGLSWLIARLNHALALYRWDIDAVVGLVFSGLKDKQIPAKNYGVYELKLCIDGYFWPNGKTVRAYQALTPRDFIYERTRNDLDQIRNSGDQNMRDLAPIAKKRKHEPSIHRFPPAD